RDGMVENGNYVNNYLCHEELHNEWPRHSTRSIDSLMANGYTLEPVLIRYLNALGLTKDSAGVAQLTPDQIADIENGIPNPVYTHSWQGKRMLYVTLFEIESYRSYRAVTGFTMLQRLEMWRATVNVIGEHPWWGCGMSEMRHQVNDELHALQSPMADSGFYPHNQYLSWMVTFGIVGFAIVLFFFLRTAPALRRQDALLLVWTVVILISFLTEDTLGSLVGRLFCTWLMAFRKTNALTH
ncbi:MAG: O-antigen ligase family protein, partial [Prevotella sp.]